MRKSFLISNWTKLPCFWHLFQSSRLLVSNENSSYVFLVFYSCANDRFVVSWQMQPISQVCAGKTSSQNTSQHIIFPQVLISSCVKLLVCTFKYLQPRLCSFVFFMWTERNGSHDFWTLSCPLGETLVFLSPDPVNWCISLVSTQPTSLEAVSSF